MELALESTLPFAFTCALNSDEANRFFTPVWASSKLPWMPMTWVLEPPVVVICSFCTSLTPSEG